MLYESSSSILSGSRSSSPNHQKESVQNRVRPVLSKKLLTQAEQERQSEMMERQFQGPPDLKQKLGVVNIMMLYDKECSDFFSNYAGLQIIKLLLSETVDLPISKHQIRELKGRIDNDKNLKFSELYKILIESPVSCEAHNAAQKLYRKRLKEAKCSCAPLWCF